jgi:hypothetical protein
MAKTFLLLASAAVALVLAGCKHSNTANLAAIDKSGVWLNEAAQLRDLGVTDAEVQQLTAVRQAGMSAPSCLELVRIAHGHHQPFSDGQPAATLVHAGLKEPTVVELERLGQLSSGAGEAQAMHLARLSDDLILAVAQRTAAGLPGLSGSRIAALQNIGYTENQLMAEVTSGTTDAQADAIIARRNDLGNHQGFVHQNGRRH